jgi:hypothetical protein
MFILSSSFATFGVGAVMPTAAAIVPAAPSTVFAAETKCHLVLLALPF